MRAQIAKFLRNLAYKLEGRSSQNYEDVDLMHLLDLIKKDVELMHLLDLIKEDVELMHLLDLIKEDDQKPSRFYFSDAFCSLIQKLAQGKGISEAEVIRTSVGLYYRGTIEKDKGRVLGVVALENQALVIKELIKI